MASSIANKVFIVMGSASGMGLATATTLLAKGAFLGLCDINQDGLSKLIQSLNEPQRNKVITQVVDITNRPKFGRIDGIARFAGTASHKLGRQEIYEIDETEYNFVMDINVRGIFNILGEALKPIVHAASMYSERGFAKGSVYSASKHASIGLVKSAAVEVGKRDKGEGTAPDVPLGRLGMASEVADVVALLLSDEARYVTGAT
ncbi:dehydrogenase [Aspergillus oryzae 100-8]|nr:dehydrogenase [Aspergillus oryzae 100-8]